MSPKKMDEFHKQGSTGICQKEKPEEKKKKGKKKKFKNCKFKVCIFD